MRIMSPGVSASTGQTTSQTSAEAAAVAAIEARFEHEARRARAERRAKNFSQFCALCLILLIVAGAVWYFAGENFLPEKYTHEKVIQHFPDGLKKLLGVKPPPPQIDPRDAATIEDRKAIARELALLEEVCSSQPPIQNVADMGKRIGASKVSLFYEEVLREDGAYAKTLQREAYMRQRNEKMEKQRNAQKGADNRRYLEQYSSKDFAAVALSKERDLQACVKARQRAIERFKMKMMTCTAKWAGPSSKIELKKFNDRLEMLVKCVCQKTWTD